MVVTEQYCFLLRGSIFFGIALLVAGEVYEIESNGDFQQILRPLEAHCNCSEHRGCVPLPNRIACLKNRESSGKAKRSADPSAPPLCGVARDDIRDDVVVI